MSKKTLNLSIEESIKRRAKRIAEQRGISVSQFFEEMVIREKDTENFTPEPGSWTESLYGSAKLPAEYEGMSYKQIKEKEVLKKHGR